MGAMMPTARTTRSRLRARGLLAPLLLMGVAAGMAPGPEAHAAQEPPEPRPLSYSLEARPGPDALEFLVRLEFTADDSGETLLILPSHWGGQERLFEGIRDLRSEGATLGEGEGDHERLLTHAPGATIRLTYRFVQDRDPDFSEHGRTHRPLLSPQYFHFIGHGAFVAPAWPEDEVRRITLTWSGLPEGWSLGHSFGEGREAQSLEISIDQLRHALYVGGDFRIHRLLIHDRPVVVGIRGDWPFSDGEYTSLVAGIVRSQREFWNDHDFPHFLITMIPMGTACCSFGGTSVNNAFATFIATDDGLDMRMKHLLAHELMHTWIGQKMRNASAPGEPESLLYWFSEGFTDYYTRELLLRAGLITGEEYVGDLNRALYDYHASPVRNEPNTRIMDDYWKDRHVQKLPYLRGELLARRWDTAIRRRTGGKASLDDLMRDLLETVSGQDRRITFDLITEAAVRRVGPEAEGDLAGFIRTGETVPPSRGALPGEVVLTEVEMSPFELGFDFDASRREGHITGVREGGPAWKAGIRDGQPIRGFGIRWDDASLPVVIHVEIDGEQEKIEYLPQGEPLMVPQFVRRAPGG